MSSRENPTVEEFQRRVQKELDEVIKIWSPSNIRSFVQNKLEGKAFEITMAALGFRYSFDRWEAQRSDVSPAMHAILDDAKDEIAVWITRQVELLPKLNKRTLVSIHAQYRDEVETQLRRIMMERARAEAVRLADQICLGIDDDDAHGASEYNMPRD